MSWDAGSRQFGAQPFHRLENDGMVGHPTQSVTPHVSRLNLPSLNPEYLSEVRGNFRIWEGVMCFAQQLFGFAVLTQLVIHPAQTIENGGITG
mgnify:CR=1 FL=1